VRQFGVAVPGGVGHVGLSARTLHETGNWLVLTDFSNAFKTVKRTEVLEEVANCVPALTPLVSKCYGTRPADVFFRTRTQGRPGRSLAPAVSSKGTPWDRQCSAWRGDRG
ncbi:unnamed protein product, partial [Laminaria digitata]